jgi:hypothetical protein
VPQGTNSSAYLLLCQLPEWPKKRWRALHRQLDRDLARSYGVPIVDLEADQQLQDAVLSVHHATLHTLNGTASAKVVENQLGRTYVVLARTVQLVGQTPGPAESGPTPNPVQPVLNRQQRRAQQRRGRP